MKPTALILATLLSGCEAHVQITQQPAATNTANLISKRIANEPLTTMDYWLEFYEVWKCADGTFEVKSNNGVRGKFGSLEEAERCRLEQSAHMVDYMLRQVTNNVVHPERGPDCGVRIR